MSVNSEARSIAWTELRFACCRGDPGVICRPVMDSVTPWLEKRLEGYFQHLGEIPGNKEQRASFATYALGILSDAERKCGEPLRAVGDDGKGECRGLDYRRHRVSQAGKHSVGVQRQCTGSAGKTTNRSELSFAVDSELTLSATWGSSSAATRRRRKLAMLRGCTGTRM
jgi:hypothetical protein